MKAACGASGVAVYVEFSKHRCYIANLGTSQCVVGWATGGALDNTWVWFMFFALIVQQLIHEGLAAKQVRRVFYVLCQL